MAEFSPERVAGTYAAHPSLTDRERRELERQGVPPQACERVRGGYIVRCGSQFELEQHAKHGRPERAFLLLVADVHGAPADIVAWQRATGWLGSWRGLAWALGQESVYRPRLDEHRALRVHPGVLEWLGDGCRGIVLIRPPLAAAFLCDAGPLLVDDAEFGAELRASLTRPAPRILVAAAETATSRAEAHLESYLS
jgi:hypothetical protein